MIVDLHSHTTASDGTFSPTALLQRAVDQGVDILAITDHDTVDAMPEAVPAAAKLPIKLVPGIEVTCFVDATEIHVLGLGIRPDADGFRDWLKGLMAQRVDRLHKIRAELLKHHIDLDITSIVQPNRVGSVGRPHIAKLLIAGGHAKDMDDAFKKWLSPGRPAFVDRLRVTAEESIKRIHDAGGIAVQAHPGQLGKDADIPRLVEWGLDGLEVFHPDHTPAMKNRYANMTSDLNLIATGGSDFHSNEGHHGSVLGARSTPHKQWDEIDRRTAG